MTLDQSPQGLATLYADIGRQLLAFDDPADAFAGITRTAVTVVPGTEWASITWGRDRKFITLAATDPRAEKVDSIQYELSSGPCVDAVVQETTYRSDDLRVDSRWPEFGRRATEATGMSSMLSFRLFLEDPDVIAGLNLYSTTTSAFDGTSEVIGTLLATHGALAVSAANARQHAAQLERALLSSRDIGVAMGVLMTTHKLTREQAFDLLRVASQTTNRKLADIALDVADTGVLTLPRTVAERRSLARGEPRRAARLSRPTRPTMRPANEPDLGG